MAACDWFALTKLILDNCNVTVMICSGGLVLQVRLEMRLLVGCFSFASMCCGFAEAAGGSYTH